MKISWKWIQELVVLPPSTMPEQVAETLTLRGLEVEAITRQGLGLEKVVTAEILERNPHPEADRLSVCHITLGSGEPLEIVCGATNMKSGDKVALAQIGAQLPNGVKIEKAKIRGVVSNGMLCSESELGLKTTSEGILILPASTQIGVPLALALGQNDIIFEVNVTPNRGDCLSHVGIARELAAAYGGELLLPKTAKLKLGRSPIATVLDAGEAGPQFWGCLIEGVKIGPSPTWVVNRLESLGVRSINNVVDASNLVLQELGQPTHAYDADQLLGNTLRIRDAKQGEKLKLLDGAEIELDGSELVIVDDSGRRPVALAGVMGGSGSEVVASTTRIFLECAEFDPVRVRRTAFRHQRRTEAALRFEKGLDPIGVGEGAARLTELVIELAGGHVVAATAKLSPSRDPKKKLKPAQISVDPSFFEDFLGLKISPSQAREALGALGFTVRGTVKKWSVTVPSYRLDVSTPEDLSEEIARSVGYRAIKPTVPRLNSSPHPRFDNPVAASLWVDDRAKDALVELGFHEALQYAFTSRAWLAQFGIQEGVPVGNPLSEEQQVLVPSLIPGLVQAALENWNHHFGSIAPSIRMFELRPTFHLRAGVGRVEALSEFDTGVEERSRFSMALSGSRLSSGLKPDLEPVDFADLKGVLEAFFSRMAIRGIRFEALKDRALWHPGQSAVLMNGNHEVGVCGRLHPSIESAIKARGNLWLAELNWDALKKLAKQRDRSQRYKAWATFPPIERDFSVLVKSEIASERVTELALRAGRPLAKVVRVFDIYQGAPVPPGMTSIAVKVIFLDESRSLEESEADAVSARIVSEWKQQLGASLRS